MVTQVKRSQVEWFPWTANSTARGRERLAKLSFAKLSLALVSAIGMVGIPYPPAYANETTLTAPSGTLEAIDLQAPDSQTTDSQTTDSETIQQLEEIVSRLAGVMVTIAPPNADASDANPPIVQMTTCEIQVDGLNMTSSEPSVFLYQEQALTDRLTQPYRQRFLRIAPSADGNGIESVSYRLRDSESWIGLCDRPIGDRTVQGSDLEDTHCRVVLVPVGENFVGDTPAGGCPSNYRGAVSVTNHIILYEDGMDTFDQGFDTEGNLVWGSTGDPYRFRKQGTSEHEH